MIRLSAQNTHRKKLGSGRKSQLSADFCVHAKVVLKSKLYGTDVM